MFEVLGIMLIGILLGRLFRTKLFIQKLNLKLLTFSVLFMLFAMGAGVAANEQVLTKLSSLGYQAFVVSAAAVLGSCVCALVVYRYIYKRS